MDKHVELPGSPHGVAFLNFGTKQPTHFQLCYLIHLFRSVLRVNKYRPGQNIPCLCQFTSLPMKKQPMHGAQAVLSWLRKAIV